MEKDLKNKNLKNREGGEELKKIHWIVLLIFILVVNSFIFNQLDNQIEMLSNRQLRSAGYLSDKVEMLIDKVEVIETKLEHHETWLKTDYTNISYLADEVENLKSETEVLRAHIEFIYNETDINNY